MVSLSVIKARKIEKNVTRLLLINFQKHVMCFLFNGLQPIYHFLCRQIETETGSAGEQPVRDIFDLHEM